VPSVTFSLRKKDVSASVHPWQCRWQLDNARNARRAERNHRHPAGLEFRIGSRWPPDTERGHCRVTGKPPRAPLAGVRMARYKMWFNPAKASANSACRKHL